MERTSHLSNGFRWIYTFFATACFPFFTIYTTPTIAQDKTFAGITFRFNETAADLFRSELEILEEENPASSRDIAVSVAILSVISSMLSETDIPGDFKFAGVYKYFQHSSLHAGEVENGVFWNFTRAEAQKEGLLISETLDERKHLTLATRTALLKILRLQKQNQHWAKTLNALIGEYKNQDDRWEGNIVSLDSFKHKELIKFLAFKSYLEKNYHKAALHEQMAYLYQNVSGKTLGEISEDLHVDIHELISGNQWLISGKILSDKYSVLLFIPVSRYYEIQQLERDHSANYTEQNYPVLTPNNKLNKGLGGTFYTINTLPGILAEMGDQFVNLAYKAGISPEKFLNYNDLKPIDNISAGRIYYLKTKGKKADIPYHIAVSGETLWDISQQYAVKLSQLAGFNRITSSTRLVPGQLIWMQKTRPKNEPVQYLKTTKPEVRKEPSPVTSVFQKIPEASLEDKRGFDKKETLILYKYADSPPFKEEISERQTQEIEVPSEADEDPEAIQKNPESVPRKKFLVHHIETGETLHQIAQKYQVDIKQLYKLNNLIDKKITAGDKLIIKKI